MVNGTRHAVNEGNLPGRFDADSWIGGGGHIGRGQQGIRRSEAAGPGGIGIAGPGWLEIVAGHGVKRQRAAFD